MRILRNVLMSVLLCLSVPLLFAQGGATGTILGTVTDNSGAVVANVGVDITNVQTGVTIRANATSSGDFTAPYLQPGIYRITVQAPGFEKAVTNGVQLNVAQEVRINIRLSVGAVTQSVQVSANAVALDTDSSSVSQTIESRQVNDLPLNGRNFLDLLTLSGGEVQTIGEAAAFRQGAEGAISINGQRATSNSYTLDGMPNVDAAEAQPAVILSVDAIQEFTLQSSTYGAQFGFSANQVNLVTKSGTNDLHGTLYEFDRNNIFDARSEFETGAPPPLRQNQFGYAVGGPVYFPHLYNGRNKTFWFASYEGWRISSSSDDYFNVPDPSWLAGNFTQSIIDPTTHLPFAGCTANGTTYVSCVPTARWSRLANLAIADKFYPAPNSTSINGNFEAPGNAPLVQNEQDYRIDQDLGRYGTVFGRGTYGTYNQTTATSLDVPVGNSLYAQTVSTWAISHTITIRNNVVNRAYFAHMHFGFDEGTGDAMSATQQQSLGLNNYFSNATGLQAAYPTITLNTGNLASAGGPPNAYLENQQPEWDFGDSVALIRGRHTVTAGLDYRNWKLNRNYNQNFFGNAYEFSGFATAGSTTPTGQTAIADMLLGYLGTVQAYVPGPLSNTTTPGAAGNPTSLVFSYVAPYVEDDWNLSSKLTINVGLRYDLRTALHDADNHFFWRDTTNVAGGICTGDKSLIGTYGVGFYRYCGETHPPTPKTPFAPRFGFAYRMGNNMVVRGGYGIFFDNFEGREFDNSQNLCPFSNQVNVNQSAGQSAPLITTDSLFPVQSPTCSFGANNALFTYNVIPPELHNPYVQQYSLSVERELGRDTSVEVNYIGNKGTHNLIRSNIAQAYPATNPAACQANHSAPGCPVADREPFANFSAYVEEQFEGYSNYNAGTAKLTHRSHDLAVTAVYTYSKSLDDKSAAASVGTSSGGWQGFQNNHDPRADYGRSDYDLPHRFVASVLYPLPFGHGQKFLGSANKAADLAVGGWQVNAIYNWQSGYPFSVTSYDNLGVLQTEGAPIRANQVGNPYPHGFHKTMSEWFDTSAFVVPPDYTFGTTGRNILSLPTYDNLNFSLFKAFNFTERYRFELRGEAFNALNHAEYGLDPSNPNQEAALNYQATLVGNVEGGSQYGHVLIAHSGRIIQVGGKFYF